MGHRTAPDATEHRAEPRHRDGDEGTILILTLLLTVVLAAIVLALATYAATGLSTSRVTTERTVSNAAATDGLTWAIEEFAKKQLVPENDAHCDSTPVALSVPAGMVESAASLSLTCERQADIDNHPTVRLSAVATTAAGTDRTIDVVLQVPAAQHTTQVHSWVVG